MRVCTVGINKYKDRDNNLYGCVNDALITRQIAMDLYKVPSTQIRMLSDERATATGIKQRLEWLVAETFVHTKLLFHYSGHGSYVPNVDYFKDDPEYDGLDEIICPHNFDWSHDTTWIKDDYFYEIIKKKNPKAKLVMIFDCCHSGTIFRGMTRLYTNSQPNVKTFNMPKIKSIPIPTDMAARIPEFQLKPQESENDQLRMFPVNRVTTAINSSILEVPNTIIISGCRDDQVSMDAHFNGEYHGALSYVLQNIWYNNPDIHVKELEEKTKAELKRLKFAQEPQFTYGPETDLSKLF